MLRLSLIFVLCLSIHSLIAIPTFESALEAYNNERFRMLPELVRNQMDANLTGEFDYKFDVVTTLDVAQDEKIDSTTVEAAKVAITNIFNETNIDTYRAIICDSLIDRFWITCVDIQTVRSVDSQETKDDAHLQAVQPPTAVNIQNSSPENQNASSSSTLPVKPKFLVQKTWTFTVYLGKYNFDMIDHINSPRKANPIEYCNEAQQKAEKDLTLPTVIKETEFSDISYVWIEVPKPKDREQFSFDDVLFLGHQRIAENDLKMLREEYTVKRIGYAYDLKTVQTPEGDLREVFRVLMVLELYPHVHVLKFLNSRRGGGSDHKLRFDPSFDEAFKYATKTGIDSHKKPFHERLGYHLHVVAGFKLDTPDITNVAVLNAIENHPLLNQMQNEYYEFLFMKASFSVEKKTKTWALQFLFRPYYLFAEGTLNTERRSPVPVSLSLMDLAVQYAEQNVTHADGYLVFRDQSTDLCKEDSLEASIRFWLKGRYRSALLSHLYDGIGFYSSPSTTSSGTKVLKNYAVLEGAFNPALKYLNRDRSQLRQLLLDEEEYSKALERAHMFGIVEDIKDSSLMHNIVTYQFPKKDAQKTVRKALKSFAKTISKNICKNPHYSTVAFSVQRTVDTKNRLILDSAEIMFIPFYILALDTLRNNFETIKFVVTPEMVLIAENKLSANDPTLESKFCAYYIENDIKTSRIDEAVKMAVKNFVTKEKIELLQLNLFNEIHIGIACTISESTGQFCVGIYLRTPFTLVLNEVEEIRKEPNPIRLLPEIAAFQERYKDSDRWTELHVKSHIVEIEQSASIKTPEDAVVWALKARPDPESVPYLWLDNYTYYAFLVSTVVPAKQEKRKAGKLEKLKIWKPKGTAAVVKYKIGIFFFEDLEAYVECVNSVRDLPLVLTHRASYGASQLLAAKTMPENAEGHDFITMEVTTASCVKEAVDISLKTILKNPDSNALLFRLKDPAKKYLGLCVNQAEDGFTVGYYLKPGPEQLMLQAINKGRSEKSKIVIYPFAWEFLERFDNTKNNESGEAIGKMCEIGNLKFDTDDFENQVDQFLQPVIAELSKSQYRYIVFYLGNSGTDSKIFLIKEIHIWEEILRFSKSSRNIKVPLIPDPKMHFLAKQYMDRKNKSPTLADFDRTIQNSADHKVDFFRVFEVDSAATSSSVIKPANAGNSVEFNSVVADALQRLANEDIILGKIHILNPDLKFAGIAVQQEMDGKFTVIVVASTFFREGFESLSKLVESSNMPDVKIAPHPNMSSFESRFSTEFKVQLSETDSFKLFSSYKIISQTQESAIQASLQENNDEIVEFLQERNHNYYQVGVVSSHIGLKWNVTFVLFSFIDISENTNFPNLQFQISPDVQLFSLAHELVKKRKLDLNALERNGTNSSKKPALKFASKSGRSDYTATMHYEYNRILTEIVASSEEEAYTELLKIYQADSNGLHLPIFVGIAVEKLNEDECVGCLLVAPYFITAHDRINLERNLHTTTLNSSGGLILDNMSMDDKLNDFAFEISKNREFRKEEFGDTNKFAIRQHDVSTADAHSHDVATYLGVEALLADPELSTPFTEKVMTKAGYCCMYNAVARKYSVTILLQVGRRQDYREERKLSLKNANFCARIETANASLPADDGGEASDKAGNKIETFQPSTSEETSYSKIRFNEALNGTKYF